MLNYRSVVGPDKIIQADQVSSETVDRLVTWTRGRKVEEINAIHSDQRHCALNLMSFGRMVRASEGTYVVKDPDQGFLVMSASSFEKLFVRCDEDGNIPGEEVPENKSEINTDPFRGMTRFGEG